MQGDRKTHREGAIETGAPCNLEHRSKEFATLNVSIGIC